MLVILVLGVTDQALTGVSIPEIERFVQMAIGAVVALALLALWSRAIDHRAFRDYGFHINADWWTDFGGGVLIGTVIQLGAMASLLALGWASVRELLSAGTSGFAAGIAAAFVARFFGGLWEESVFRAVCITNLAEGLDARRRPAVAKTLAVLLSAVFFALVHFQQATCVAGLWLVLLLGVILGAAYVLTGELAMPLGLHFAYNFAGTHLFNIAGADPTVRGEAARLPAVVRLEPVPEAAQQIAGGLAIVHLLAALSSGLLVWLWLRWRGKC